MVPDSSAVIPYGFILDGGEFFSSDYLEGQTAVHLMDHIQYQALEYYELTDELMNAKDEKGEPAYNYGVILNYLFKVQDLEKIMEEKMPLHIVEKKIPYLDENGEPVKPETPNGYKFESLVLDMIHQMIPEVAPVINAFTLKR